MSNDDTAGAEHPEKLFHYCSTETFLAIVRNKSIRLSSLSLSNDTMEGKWMQSVFGLLSNEKQLSVQYIPRLMGYIERLGGFADGLGFCLSAKPDMLSQWRGYADDGRGISIGFSTKYFLELGKSIDARDPSEQAFDLIKLEYDVYDQKRLVEPVFDRLKGLIEKGALKYAFERGSLLANAGKSPEELASEEQEAAAVLRQFQAELLTLAPHLYQIKNPAFEEEQEWRLLTFLIATQENCEFRSVADRIIPYREMKLDPLDMPAIAQVYLGPRNISRPDDIKRVLKMKGFGEVDVLKSRASYR